MHYQLVFIGGGTASLAGIAEAIEIGFQKIAYIEYRPEVGGTCALDGCVPLHYMLEAATIAQSYQKASLYGLVLPTLNLDFPSLMDNLKNMVRQDLKDPYSEDEKVVLYHGHASFISPHEIKIISNAQETTISFDQVVIATGAKPTIPDIPGLKKSGFWTYSHVTHSNFLPPKMAIIGGGRLGVEFAQVLHRLGSQITLFESKSSLLHREDFDISLSIKKLFEQEGIIVHTDCRIIQVESKETGSKEIVWSDGRNVHHLEADELLVATGREARFQDLNIEVSGVECSADSIIINEHCQTSVKHIWAIGDVAGPYRFTHAADYQAVVAVRNLSKHSKPALDYSAMPLPYFIEPSIASVGKTETQARKQFESVIVLKKNLETICVSQIKQEIHGFCKVVIDGNTDYILGAHLFCPAAEDIIHILALAIQQRIPVYEMTQLIYAYPTKAQIIQKTLESYKSIKKEHSNKN